MSILQKILKFNQSTIRLIPELCKEFDIDFKAVNMVYHPWTQLFDAGLIQIYAYNAYRDPFIYFTVKSNVVIKTGLDPEKLLSKHFDKLETDPLYTLYRTRTKYKINWFDIPDPAVLNALSYGGEHIWTEVANPLGLYYTVNNMSFGLLYNTKQTKQLFANEFKCGLAHVPDKLLPQPDLEKETFRKEKTLLYA